jgi:hypothetical protein
MRGVALIANGTDSNIVLKISFAIESLLVSELRLIFKEKL